MAIRIFWSQVSGATGYTIYRSTSSGVQGQALTTLTGNAFVDQNVAASTTYYYSVTSRNIAGESAPSSPQASVTTPATPPPTPTAQAIVSFTALPTSIVQGATVTLTWVTTNAVTVRLDGVVVANSGSTTRTPSVTSSYTLTATGSAPDVSSVASVSVSPTPPPTPQTITTFTALPATIASGSSATVTWATANATGVRLNGAVVALSGSQSVSPTTTTGYTLLVSGSIPDISQSRTVTVTQPTPAQAITSFTATPSSIFVGTSSTLAWSTTNALTATINGSSVGTSGNLVVSPTSTTVYTLVITGSAAPVGQGVTVTVQASAQTPPQWSTVPDIVFTQGVASTVDMSAYVTDAQGDPFTLSVSSGTLPSGVTLDGTTKILSYDGVGAVDVKTGIIFAADDAATPQPDPPVLGYPTGTELAFGDTQDTIISNEGTSNPAVPIGYNWGAAYKQNPLYTDGRSAWPGPYVGGYAAIEFNNLGGDWKDAQGTSQGAIPFASCTFSGSHNGNITANWNAAALTSLVKSWVGGTANNYGLFLRCSNGNIIQFRSRFYADATMRPVLTVTSTSQGTVPIAATRTQWLDSSTSIPRYNNAELRVTGATDYSMVWFDVSRFPNAADVTNVTLTLTSFDQWGSCSVNVFAVDNPGDESSLGPIQLGIAANYPLDVGIIADANVLMVEYFADSAFMGSTAQINAGLTRWNWNNSVWNVPDAPLQGDYVTAASDANGFTQNQGYRAWKVRYEAAQLSAGQSTPQAGSLSAEWYPSKTPSYHAKALQYCDELFFRYYMLLGDNYDPRPQGGKAFGFTMRWDGISGMGAGNGGSGCNGFTGASARGGFGIGDPSGTSPLSALRGFDWYCYNIGQPDSFGSGIPWNRNYLGWLRKGRWYSVEQRLKMNTVSNDRTGSFSGQPTLAGGVATWTLSSADAFLVTGEYIYISGVTGGGGVWNGAFRYTRVDSTHIQVTVGGSATLPIGGTPVYKNGTANADGILQSWVNGRLAASYTNIRWRASMTCTDNVTPFAIEGIWLNAYMGGICYPYTGPFEYYVSNMVIAKAYIGPMVTA